MNKLFLLSLPLLLWACGGDHDGHEHGDHADHDHHEGGHEMTSHAYGVEFSSENAISFADLQTKMQSTDRMTCVLEAEIVESCQKMGCWMSVATNGEPMMVYMNDHEFFVPKEGVAGLKSFINGEAYFDTVSVDFQKHLLEDANRPQEELDAITEPKFELAFNATGVIIEGYQGDDAEMHEGHDHDDHDHGDEHDHDEHDHGDEHDHEGHDHSDEQSTTEQ